MQHVERAGVHSGDSIAVYPPFSLDDSMIETVVRSSTQLALGTGEQVSWGPGVMGTVLLTIHSKPFKLSSRSSCGLLLALNATSFP